MANETPVMALQSSGYQRGWRRMLVDMEIPAWDESFLAEYDPVAMVDRYERANTTSVMFVCKSLNGWCFWPTEVGAMHPRLNGRDVVGETVPLLRERGIAACAYYSVIFDNWPAARHPDWRIVSPTPPAEPASPRDRHGICCPNNPDYRDYIADQIADLYRRYEFDASFCDMTFWPRVCLCRACRARYWDETGFDIPGTVDWTSPAWCAFQAARERWIADFTGLVTAAMRQARTDIAVYHNFAPGPVHWTWAVPFAVTEHSDFLGGDLYGDDLEQLLVMKLMSNLSRSRPAEFMTFATVDCYEHTTLKSADRMRAQVLGAAAESTAFMFIEAIDPTGTAAEDTYDRIGDAFEAMASVERHLGGQSIEDVAVYFSNESKMDFAENGRPLTEVASASTFPHLAAVRGVCRTLQRAHVQFGVITRRQLAALDRYRVVVLPDVSRMDAEEVAAIRRYVHGGGRVYASRYTSLVESRGVRHDDFMLADVFGVHVESEEPTGPVYAKPATDSLRRWLLPQRFLTLHSDTGLAGGLVRLRADPGARILATLSLPHGHPRVGSFGDEDWASIHSFPPVQDTADPVLVEHDFGCGRAVYSAFDIERDDSEANHRVLAALIDSLLDGERSVQCVTHPRVWASAFRLPDAIRVALRNGPPAIVASARLQIRVPDGMRFVGLQRLPSGVPLPFELAADGTLTCELDQVNELDMLLASHEPSAGTP